MKFMSSVIRRLIVLVIVAFSAALGAQAQQLEGKFDFYNRGEYRTGVPRPQSILRYDVGDHHTTYAQMEKVIDEIAKAAPDRVRVFDIGLTNEYRMQHIVAISSPKNIARLEEIKALNARLTDPRTTSPADAQKIIKDIPSIAWMAYTIHGNESASFEAMMQVVYQLAASNEAKTLEILDNTVVLVITGENPDGHERFITWYNSVATGNADRLAFEHREPWSVWGRYNRYRFDLNRDGIATTQVEIQNLHKAKYEWNPQLVIDHHGQPSQFFFPPTALPINPNFPQPVTNEWMQIFGKANAAAFDANKWAFYNRDVYDLFYPGYIDSYSTLNGAVGMTYETDGGGNKGLRYTRDDGTIVTLRSAIAKHYVASMTSLETLAKNKAKRQQDFYDFRRNAMAEQIPMKRIVILPEKDRVKTAEMLEILRRARVEIKVATAPFSSTVARSYEAKDSPAERRTFPAGSYVIDLNQPQKKLIKALMEQDTPQDAAFVKEETAKFKRNEMRGKNAFKERYRFYDITAWSLPLAFGIDAYWTEDAPAFDGKEVTSEMIDKVKRGDGTAKAAVAYIMPYETDSTGVMAIRLLKEGFKVNVSTRVLTAEGKNYPQGSFVVRIARNPESVHEAVSRLATELGVRVVPINSGYSEEGDTPVGGQNVFALTEPKIVVVADDAVDQTSYGSIWWTLDRYGIKFTAMSIANLSSGLKDYNVLIIPDGQAGRYASSFGPGGIANLKDWVSKGGTLITCGGASVFATLKNVGLTSAKMVGSEDEDEKSSSKSEASKAPAAQQQEAARSDKQDWEPPVLPPIASPSAFAGKVPEGVPGSIMRATVDRTSYINYGITSNEIPVLLSTGYFLRYSKEGTNALIFEANPKRSLTMSGFVWEGNTEPLLKGTAYVIDEPVGGGNVVLFADEPFFRGIFRSVTRPFMNSILFPGSF